MKNFAKLLIIFGLLCYSLAGYYLWLRNDPHRLQFEHYANAQTVSVKKEKVIPINIVIKDLHIDLPVIQARITGNNWETTENGVSYLTSSPLPGATGNSVFYGHNWANLLGPLVNIRTGQEIEVVMSDKSKKKFTVEYISVVSPEESSILAPSKDKRITMYTCTGFLDEKRFVVVAVLR